MNERCDAMRCGARAWVKADLRGVGTLYFCGHHGTEYMGALLERDFEITDERSEILHIEDNRPAIWATGMALKTGDLVYNDGYIYRWKLADLEKAPEGYMPKGNKSTSTWEVVE